MIEFTSGMMEEAALIQAIGQGIIAGAGLDVYDTEPLPSDHPYRTLPNVIFTPHIGYVTEDSYRMFFGGIVENLEAWLAGQPIRILSP